jgi:hypothetical protein
MRYQFPESVHSVALPGSVVDLDVSSDGGVIAVALRLRRRDRGVVQLYETAGGTLLGQLGLESRVGGSVSRPTRFIAARGVSFADGDRKIVFALQDDRSENSLWSVRQGEDPVLWRTLEARECYSMIRDADGGIVGLVGDGLTLFRTADQSLLRTVAGPRPNTPTAACFTADRDHVLVQAPEGGAISKLDLRSGAESQRWIAPHQVNMHVAAASDESGVVIVGADHQGAFAYAPSPGRFRPGLFDGQIGANHFVFTPDGRMLITSAGRLWGFEPAEGDGKIEGPMVGGLTRAVGVASARPLVAFGMEDDRLVWFEMLRA